MQPFQMMCPRGVRIFRCITLLSLFFLHNTHSQRFFYKLGHTHQEMLKLQEVLEGAVGKYNIVGNIAGHYMQVYYYAKAAFRVHPKVICEIGFGAGHSTAIWLTMTKARLYTFDVFNDEVKKGQQEAAIAHIIASGGDASRWERIKGLSNATGREFKHRNITCDVVHIDGSHELEDVYWDIMNFAAMSSSTTVVLMDDINISQGPRPAMERAIADGIIKKYNCLAIGWTYDAEFKTTEVVPHDDRDFCELRYIK